MVVELTVYHLGVMGVMESLIVIAASKQRLAAEPMEANDSMAPALEKINKLCYNFFGKQETKCCCTLTLG